MRRARLEEPYFAALGFSSRSKASGVVEIVFILSLAPAGCGFNAVHAGAEDACQNALPRFELNFIDYSLKDNPRKISGPIILEKV